MGSADYQENTYKSKSTDEIDYEEDSDKDDDDEKEIDYEEDSDKDDDDEKVCPYCKAMPLKWLNIYKIT
ncbi:hypothetical protein RhiirA5_430524 [Rhizophagus irregularis]|uniref:Uncharacterized protein n=1 Tax=Rhizophagus irregularis TaxID=588596 RepID=A0A2N0NWL6_9GLOM|nr:hypothetical protein RhiirA5_430524 [Rhizophagus irregularis]